MDTSASGSKSKLSAPRSASRATELSNLTAKGAARVKDIKGKATGIFGSLAARFPGKKADTSKEEPEEGDAFNAAQREYEPTLFAEIREGWVKRHMTMRADDYTAFEPLNLSVLTWNVAAKKPPPSMELAALLGPIASGCRLLAIGLQESVELSAQNVSAGADGRLAGTAVQWESAITGVICEHGFQQIVCRQMMGIVLLVYVHEELRPACSTPRTCSVGTGLLVRTRALPTSSIHALAAAAPPAAPPMMPSATTTLGAISRYQAITLARAARR